jgi:hypothetical protein
MTEQDKIATEGSLTSLGNGYFGICALGGIIWIVMAMDGSPAPAVMLSIGVGIILTGAMVFCGIRLLVGMSHSLRTIASRLPGK